MSMDTLIWGPTIYGYLAIITTLVLHPLILKLCFPSNISESLYSWTFISLCLLAVFAYLITALDQDTRALFYSNLNVSAASTEKNSAKSFHLLGQPINIIKHHFI